MQLSHNTNIIPTDLFISFASRTGVKKKENRKISKPCRRKN